MAQVQRMKIKPSALLLLLPLLLILGWMSVIFFMSTSFGQWEHSQAIIQALLAPFWAPAPEALTSLNLGLRKLAHFSEYALLLTVMYWGLKSLVNLTPRTLLAVVLTLAIVFAISDEFHQAFVPGRTSQLLDVMIDSMGASVMAIATLVFERHRAKIALHSDIHSQ